MTTLAELKVSVARDLNDPDAKTFLDADLLDMINGALAEVGRIAPRRFQEDIDVADDTLEYQVQSLYFPVATPEIEVVRVEVWDGSVVPPTYVTLLRPMTAQPQQSSDAGWRCWNGTLSLPNAVQSSLVTGTHVLRLWGYAPFLQLSDDSDVLDTSPEQYWAVRDFCKVEGLEKLIESRDLFTQWQTRTGNTDVSPASLMNQLAMARDNWRRRARSLAVLREG